MAKLTITQEQAEQIGYLASAATTKMPLVLTGAAEGDQTVVMHFAGEPDSVYRINTIGEVEYRPGKEQPNG